MSDRHLVRTVSNVVVFATAVATILVAVTIFYVTAKVAWFATHPTWQKIGEEIAAVVFVTGFLTVVWELRARRALVAEVLTAAHLSRSIADAGLDDITADFLGDIDWKSLFDGTQELDLFFAYGGTWRANNIERLREVNRKGSRIRVVLPDPDSHETVAELARRFGMPHRTVIEKIQESITTFEDLANEPGAKAKIEVHVLAKTPMYSYYRFDDVAVFAMYHHKGIRSTVPAFRVRRGSLFTFLESDIGAIMDGNNAHARIVFRKR